MKNNLKVCLVVLTVILVPLFCINIVGCDRSDFGAPYNYVTIDNSLPLPLLVWDEANMHHFPAGWIETFVVADDSREIECRFFWTDIFDITHRRMVTLRFTIDNKTEKVVISMEKDIVHTTIYFKDGGVLLNLTRIGE